MCLVIPDEVAFEKHDQTEFEQQNECRTRIKSQRKKDRGERRKPGEEKEGGATEQEPLDGC